MTNIAFENETKSSNVLKLDRSSTTARVSDLGGSVLMSDNNYFLIGLGENVWFIPSSKIKQSLLNQGNFIMATSFLGDEEENLILEQAKKDLNVSELSKYNEAVIKKINKLSYHDILFEDVFDALNIKVKLSEKLMLVLTFPNEESYQNSETALFTLLEEEEAIIRNVQPVDEIIEGIKMFLNEPEVSIQDYS